MAVRKGHLQILFIVALSIGTLGMILSAFLASFAFMIFSLPNLSLAMFFGYKYYTYDKKMQQYEERRRRGRKRH
ncbi:MAG: hypothetical protein WB443_15485 [Nitrososphaeraceae archaeon]